jgi:hypothetical protein
LIIDGHRQIDYCDVLWLQSAEWYVDIRLRITQPEPPLTDEVAIRFARERAFAGIASWQSPLLTWEHLIDIATDPPADCNPLEWTRGGVLERGIHRSDGRDVPWVEEWLRIDAAEPVASVADDRRHLKICVGDWAVEVRDERPNGRFVAVRQDRIDGCWRQIGEVIDC